MKKIFLAEAAAVLVLTAVMFILLYRKEPADVPLDTINAAFTQAFSTDGMEPAGDMRFKRSYGLNTADYEDVLYYVPDNTMSVNEFLIVKCFSEDDTASVLDACKSRIAVQKKNFDGYGTDQTALLNQAELFSEGRYVCLFISGQASDWAAAVKKVWEE